MAASLTTIRQGRHLFISPSICKNWIEASTLTTKTFSSVTRAPNSSQQVLLLSHRHHSRHRSLLNCRRWKTTNSDSSSGNGSNSRPHLFMQRFLAPKPMPPRNTPKWYAEMALICTVFGITGSSTMFLVRPAVSEGLGLRGSMKDGKNHAQRERTHRSDADLADPCS